MLATVLIVVITVAIIGLAYGWSVGMFETVSDTSTELVEQQAKIGMARIEVRSATANKIYIRNTGQIDVTEFTVFKNGIQITSDNLDIVPEALPTGDTGSIVSLSGIFAEVGEVNVIKITTAEGAEVEITVSNLGETISYTQGSSGTGPIISEITPDTVTEVPVYVDLSGLDKYVVTGDTTLLPGTYDIVGRGDYGAIMIEANDVTLDCNGATLIGDWGIGIESEGYSNLVIKNCNVLNYNYGILLHVSSNNNLIENNTIIGGGFSAITIWDSSNNIITGNTLNSLNKGIHFQDLCENNLIYNNNFTNEGENANDPDTASTNIWNISKTLGTNIIGGECIGGNYWNDDDYDRTDIYSGPNQDQLGSDGIGDTPYTSSNGNVIDELPLVE